MKKWMVKFGEVSMDFNTAGLLFNLLGIVIGLYPPKIVITMDNEESVQKQRWVQLRYYTGAALVFVGTILQLKAASH